MSASIEEQGAHVRQEEKAIRLGYTLLNSWMEYGITPENDFPDSSFPTVPLCAVAKTVRIILESGKRGWQEVMGELIDAPQEMRACIMEAAGILHSFSPLTPSTCERIIESLGLYHRTKTYQRLTWKLQGALEAGENPSAIISELAGIDTGETGQAFAFSHADDMEDVEEPSDFVEGLLTDGTASVVYGPSNCGKSFWVLDLAVCVATGQPFRCELETAKGTVVYVALEGATGIRNRIIALRQAGRLPAGSPLFLCFVPVSLLEPGHAEKLAATVQAAAKQSNLQCRLVVIDTLARAMAGGDENGAKDMTLAVQSIDKVKKSTGAHVLVVHHCGKDEARGARGHSSLRAAVDTEIEVSRPEATRISTVRVTKQRDLPIREPMPFSLKVIELETDNRGNSITSCVVAHEDPIMAEKPRKAGRKPKYHADMLLDFLPAENVADWQTRTCEETGMTRTTFYELKKELEFDSRTKRGTGKQGITRA